MLRRLPYAAWILIGLVAILVFQTGNAFAMRSPWTEFDHSAIRLLSAVNASGELKSIPAGVEIRLAPGWRTYWRFPGRLAIP